MNWIKKLALAAGLWGTAVGLASAAPVLVDPSHFVGSCNVVSGCVDATNGWTTQNFTVSYAVTGPATVSDPYHYSYTFTGSLDPLDKQLSHILLELSPSITAENFADILFNFTASNGVLVTPPDTYEPTSGGTNPNMPGNLYGIKIDSVNSGGTTISFDAFRSPIWGDFYAKDGNNCPPTCLPGDPPEVTAWNSGFGTDPLTEALGPSGWIPTPDTTDTNTGNEEATGRTTDVPAPSALVLAGLGLSLLALRRRR